MTAFVFKIQANMDPNHRDRIAFARLCSGKLTRGMKAKLVRTGKTDDAVERRNSSLRRIARIADEAFAGDVVGIPNHGTLRIGDTLTEGEDINFVGVPSFAPEIVRRVRLTDAMKAKKLKEALQQMSEEGVVQVFPPARRRAGSGRRGRNVAARCAESAARCRIFAAGGFRGLANFSWRAGFHPTTARSSMHSSPPTAPASPTTSMATRCFWLRTNSISATPESAPKVSCSPASRT